MNNSNVLLPYRIILFNQQGTLGETCSQFATNTSLHPLTWLLDEAIFAHAISEKQAEAILVPISLSSDYSQLRAAEMLAQEAGLLCVPLVTLKHALLLGPLFGPTRSCAQCWSTRLARLNPTTRDMYRTPFPHSAIKTRILVLLAMSLLPGLLASVDTCCQSPYLLYNIQTHWLSRGTLTSMQECDTCRDRLRSNHSFDSSIRHAISVSVAERAEHPLASEDVIPTTHCEATDARNRGM